ncbi:hypothetical protein ACFU8W_42050 [Streptomyces sp. NPDC057565]|uniref:hypothetical protein n=1 Tax=Streptomyces sp. NPDC057565 TaxID=3346169 RepID=UPI0036B00469
MSITGLYTIVSNVQLLVQRGAMCRFGVSGVVSVMVRQFVGFVLVVWVGDAGVGDV